jgi:cob(I)alamin adenosyltransferase
VSELVLERLSVAYGPSIVLRDISLTVPNRGWLALVGPNGSGKTSALLAIAGLVGFQGEVRIDDRSTADLARKEVARSVAFVPQFPSAPAGMRVGPYILLGRSPRIGYLSQESRRDRALAAQACRRLGISHLEDREVASLSGGERQLASLARAVAQEPSILLADEPTSALDIGNQQEVLDAIDELRSTDGMTIVTAMHDLTHAGQYATSVALLSKGELVVHGAARDVLTEDAIFEHYGALVSVSMSPSGPVIVPQRPSASHVGAPLESDEGAGSADGSDGRSVPPTEPPVRARRERAQSLVMVATGDGKGKSTSAFGVVMRAVARGWKVAVIQFVKSGDWRVGEETICRELGVDWWSIGDGFTWDSDDLDRSEEVARVAWSAGSSKIASGDYDVVVLDEITYPMNWGWIDTQEVVDVILGRPPRVNVIATGRDAPPGLVQIADTVTEMRNVRHPFDRGIAARRGIDY